MASTKLDRLLFAQGCRCFFCKEPLAKARASVEHLVATSNGGRNDDENCVACCMSLNRLLGSMSLKEKVQVVLNQKGNFRCPKKVGGTKKPTSKPKVIDKTLPPTNLEVAIRDLQRRGASRPKTVKTLTNSLHFLFKEKLTDDQLSALLLELEASGVLQIAEQEVSYEFQEKGS